MGKREATGAPPKGWMAIRVGAEGEEQRRFLVPVMYINHPLFLGLLKEAEEEYGFDHKGAISIPCDVEHFCHVQDIIERDCRSSSPFGSHHHHGHHGHHHGHGHGHGHHHFPIVGCFRA
jgi:SAUR family protein